MTRGGRVQSAATRFSHRPLGASRSAALRSPLAGDRPVPRHNSPLRGASFSLTIWARAPSGRAWQGPQMAAAPRRGWSRGGCRAPSRGSLGLALAALASTGEGRRGEVSPEPARVQSEDGGSESASRGEGRAEECKRARHAAPGQPALRNRGGPELEARTRGRLRR